MALPSGEKPNTSNGGNLAKTEPAEADWGVDVGKHDTQQSSASPPPLIRASTTPHLSNPSSTLTSPKPSREASPIRPPLKVGISEGSKGLRSRKNSTDTSLSPTRLSGASQIPTVPSAAAIQRALSVAGTPQLQPSASSESSVDAPKPQRPNKASSGSSGQAGLNASRVKSPPPTAVSKPSIAPLRKTEHTSSTPSIVLERPTPTASSSTQTEGDVEDIIARQGMRTPNRGISASGSTLETVQESSLPATPAIGTGWPQSEGKGGPDDRPERIDENPMEDALGKDGQSKPGSGSESGGNKSVGAQNESKGPKKAALTNNSAKPQIMHSKISFTQLHPAKGKTGSESTVKNMTVETETVSSIPQVALGGGAGERSMPSRTDTGGIVRLKPSTETIRPKKEKKKVVRKAPSINSGTGGFQSRRFHHHHMHARPPSPTISLSISSPDFASGFALGYSKAESNLQKSNPKAKLMQSNRGRSPPTPSSPSSSTLTTFRVRTASSKADIFEAKVASAVDQTNSSDSDETFVYESNPPEPLSARPHRFHSRTPSATSMASQIDTYGSRARQEGHHSIAGKKSMKFTNSPYTATNPSEEGTVRGPNHSRRTSGGNSTHHHIGRHGRGGHTSLFDQESPFPGAAKPLRSAASNVAQINSRPSSPRSPHVLRVPGSGKKPKEPLLYDLEGEGADDERTPLIGSTRSGRNRIRRPLSGSSRRSYTTEKEYHLCRRVTAYVSLGTLLALLVAAVVGVLILCSQPLRDVYVKDIQNVLASEQEMMLDLHVHAMNPNLIAVQVTTLDVSIFAKSTHIGTGQAWRDQHPHGPGSLSSSLSEYSPHKTRPHESTPTANAPNDPTFHTVDDPIDDPLPDPGTDSQTMLLGRIFEFDSPLIFEPSPFRRHSQSSVGEVRLAKPGNSTEEGGSDRWEKVLLYDFVLKVDGHMWYTSPLGTETRSAKIFASVIVHPGEGVDRMGDMAISTPRTSYPAANNVLPDGFRGALRGIKVRFVA